jgi:hypothetical protein
MKGRGKKSTLSFFQRFEIRHFGGRHCDAAHEISQVCSKETSRKFVIVRHWPMTKSKMDDKAMLAVLGF